MKVFGLPVGADGCGYHRCYQPLAELRRRGHNVMLPERGMVWLPDAELNAGQIDVFAGQLLTGPRGMGLWESWRGKTALVYDIDDDVFNSDHEGSLWHRLPECRDIAAYLLAISDLVTVSTEPLVDVVKRYNPNVVVLRNCVHEDMLKIERPRRERVTVGWSGGTSHLRDFRYAAPMLSRFLARNPAVDFHFVGADYSPLKEWKAPQGRHTPWQPDVWDYYAGVDFDIGVAPLDPASRVSCDSSSTCAMPIAFAASMVAAIVLSLPASWSTPGGADIRPSGPASPTGLRRPGGGGLRLRHRRLHRARRRVVADLVEDRRQRLHRRVIVAETLVGLHVDGVAVHVIPAGLPGQVHGPSLLRKPLATRCTAAGSSTGRPAASRPRPSPPASPRR